MCIMYPQDGKCVCGAICIFPAEWKTCDKGKNLANSGKCPAFKRGSTNNVPWECMKCKKAKQKKEQGTGL